MSTKIHGRRMGKNERLQSMVSLDLVVLPRAAVSVYPSFDATSLSFI
jgi:hypothetical protein